MLQCPFCRNIMSDRPRSYNCECGFTIWKEVSGRVLSSREIDELTKEGRTPVLTFRARSGKTFSARLVLDRDGRKVAFDFAGEVSTGSPASRLRIESANSGSVFLRSPFLSAHVNYGLVSSRLAEVYGCITLVRLAPARIEISVNNLDTAKYILREAWPRDRETQSAVRFLWGFLENRNWSCKLERHGNRKLYGGASATAFPKGIFPWFDVSVPKDSAGVFVVLPAWPDLRAQFLASVRTATLADGGYRVPLAAEKVLTAWLHSVRRDTGHETGS